MQCNNVYENVAFIDRSHKINTINFYICYKINNYMNLAVIKPFNYFGEEC